jgi:hypothetical protein
VSIAITHPGARLLVPALDTLAEVVAGDWSSAARLCAARLEDPVACAVDLRVAAVRAGVSPSRPQRYRYRLHHRVLFVDECPDVLAAALDLHVKLWMGQWDALEQVVVSGRVPARDWRPHELVGLRLRHQRHDTWSRRPDACRSLFLAPTTARLAHHVLAELDSSVPRRVHDLPAGPAHVHVS